MSTFDPHSAAVHFRLDEELKTVHLVRPTMLIGRSPNSDIPLSSRMVSRQHASLTFESDAWWVEDQKSSGGTYVNGLRVERQQLRDGDRIQLGDVELHFTILGFGPCSTVGLGKPVSLPEPIAPRHELLPEGHFDDFDVPAPGPLPPVFPSSRPHGDIADLRFTAVDVRRRAHSSARDALGIRSVSTMPIWPGATSKPSSSEPRRTTRRFAAPPGFSWLRP